MDGTDGAEARPRSPDKDHAMLRQLSKTGRRMSATLQDLERGLQETTSRLVGIFADAETSTSR